ncbi:hypothetical protein PJ985_04760 [Streptomyces sp. ACA25]|uniref:hypothetical protein n=1 Tax=Streptomyces sp. ACA25 TaxID=3022596 RepID=UPI0023071D2F|nr:hypothetical protein [Streptomyces sp. ACA25]MDB1086874.1 hypothetical protein [Streptomyces sp. ACA25]
MTVRARRWRSGVGGALCAGLAAVLIGCGSPDPDEGTNGLAQLPAETIEDRAREAAGDAEALRLSGSVVTEGGSFRLDMRLGPEGGIGEVSTQGTTFELLRVGEELFIKADAAFWEHQQVDSEEEAGLDSSPADKLVGKYVKVAPEDPAYEQLSGFTDKSVMLEGLLTLEGERRTGERGELGGVQTIQVVASEGAGGVMEISLIGTPYPMRLARGGEAGELRMADWNKEFTLRAPKEDQVVDYGDQILKAGPED